LSIETEYLVLLHDYIYKAQHIPSAYCNLI